jgi:hypothetical protein
MDYTGQCSCVYCKEIKSVKGIHTHVDRTHLGSTKYSSGNNGKYDDPNYKESIRLGKLRSQEEKYGKLLIFKVNCHKCGCEMDVEERESQHPVKEKYYCSRSCVNSHERTEESKEKTRHSVLTGLKCIVKPIIERNIVCICEGCGIEFIAEHRPRKFCTRSCGTSFVRKRDSKPTNGIQDYRSKCAFKFSIKDYPEEFDFSLIEEYGWYKAANRGNNLNGISRDHMISVVYGFENNILPEHISHPANCKLMRHNDNVSKGKKASITYEELLIRIKEWDLKYAK